MEKQLAIEKMNDLGSAGTPFICIVDFEMEDPMVYTLPEAASSGIRFKIHEEVPAPSSREFFFNKNPVSKLEYNLSFSQVINELNYGNTYLLNLTMPTEVETNLTLGEIFDYSRAPFKLLVDDKFVVFSPESFVRIGDRYISTFPMKGTIKASEHNAEMKILSDPKEQAEHATIVDLLRNDISRVSTNVKVKRYRYVEKVETYFDTLLQVSSEICGELLEEFNGRFGDIIFSLLPAGSVTGAPKEKTVEIIRSVEKYKRGYFTGVFGYFDGGVIESAVMIRFIEKTPKGLIFKSGGGITAQSDPDLEYRELIDKVYVPII